MEGIKQPDDFLFPAIGKLKLTMAPVAWQAQISKDVVARPSGLKIFHYYDEKLRHDPVNT
tara:strand:+ start:2773 stop:2952 length:180 start_codon:yes stop_codon:yes gene_type:complete